MPRGHKFDLIYSFGICGRFSGTFSQRFPRICLLWEKRPLCCLWGNNDHTSFFGGTLILLLQRAKALGYLDETTEREGI